MVTSLQNKYKDKTATETIENVQEFFKSKNYTTEISHLKEPAPNVWWCTVKLKYKNMIIQSANGKGASKEYALASGYSELYERYCNFCGNILGQKINQQKLFELNLKKNNYRIFPDEEYISISEINKLPILKKFYDSLNDSKDSLTKYLNMTYPEGLLALPYQGFNQNDMIKIPFTLGMLANGSSGMAAGNSIEEALTQGLSEICEHYVHYSIYYENRIFYYLDLNQIDLPDYLQNYFNYLSEQGFLYYIYDFSYLYQLPVIGLLIVDPIKHVSYLDIGAAPNFIIALERCCTEVYQGHTILGDSIKQNMLPCRAIPVNQAIESSLVCMPLGQYYPENLILKSQQVSRYNNKIFLNNNNYSNKDLNNYYRKVFNNKNWQVYYRDYSQSENIKAIRCYVKNVPIMNVNIDNSNEISDSIKQDKWNLIFKWEQLIKNYFDNQLIDSELLSEILYLRKIISQHPVAGDSCFITDFLRIPKEAISSFNFFTFLDSIETKNWNMFFSEQPNSFSELRFYLILLLHAQHYTKEEIKEISKFYNVNYSEEDLSNSKNLSYILDKIYFNPYYNYYYNENYEKLIESYIPVVIK